MSPGSSSPLHRQSPHHCQRHCPARFCHQHPSCTQERLHHLRGISSVPPDRLGREKRSGRPLWTFFKLKQLSRELLGHSQLCRFLGSLVYNYTGQVTNVVWSHSATAAAAAGRGSKSVQNCASCFNFPHDQPPNWLRLPSAGIVIPRYSGIITWAFWWCGATR